MPAKKAKVTQMPDEEMQLRECIIKTKEELQWVASLMKCGGELSEWLPEEFRSMSNKAASVIECALLPSAQPWHLERIFQLRDVLIQFGVEKIEYERFVRELEIWHNNLPPRKQSA